MRGKKARESINSPSDQSISSIKLRSTHKKTQKQFSLCQNQAFHLDMYTLLGFFTLVETSLNESKDINADFAGLMWKPNCFWCTMESSQT